MSGCKRGSRSGRKNGQTRNVGAIDCEEDSEGRACNIDDFHTGKKMGICKQEVGVGKIFQGRSLESK